MREIGDRLTGPAQQRQQLGDVHHNPPRLILGEQFYSAVGQSLAAR